MVVVGASLGTTLASTDGTPECVKIGAALGVTLGLMDGTAD